MTLARITADAWMCHSGMTLGNPDVSRAIPNKGGRPGTGSDVINLCTSRVPAGHSCNGDSDPDFNVAPYVVAYLAKDPSAPYIRTGMSARSNLGRNTFPTQPINNWDFSVLKRVGIKERYKFEVGAQLLLDLRPALPHMQIVALVGSRELHPSMGELLDELGKRLPDSGARTRHWT